MREAFLVKDKLKRPSPRIFVFVNETYKQWKIWEFLFLKVFSLFWLFLKKRDKVFVVVFAFFWQ